MTATAGKAGRLDHLKGNSATDPVTARVVSKAAGVTHR